MADPPTGQSARINREPNGLLSILLKITDLHMVCDRKKLTRGPDAEF